MRKYIAVNLTRKLESKASSIVLFFLYKSILVNILNARKNVCLQRERLLQYHNKHKNKSQIIYLKYNIQSENIQETREYHRNYDHYTISYRKYKTCNPCLERLVLFNDTCVKSFFSTKMTPQRY